MTVAPISDLISHAIGGGWGDGRPGPDCSEPAFVIRGTDIPKVLVGKVSTVPLRYHRSSNLTARALQSGDIVFEVSGGSKGQPVGRALLITEHLLEQFQHPVICASFCKRLRLASDRCDPRFVFRRLQLSYVNGELAAFQVQSTGITNFRWKPFVEQWSFDLPSEDRQRSISRVFDAIDGLIENNRRRIDVLEQMAQAIYREWFVRFRFPGHENATFVDSSLGLIPESWESSVSGDLTRRGLLDIGDGYRAKNAEMLTAGTGLPFLRVGNVRDGYIDLDRCDHLPSHYGELLGGKVSQPGDSVISMKGTVGRTAVIDSHHPQVAYSPQVSYWRSLNHSIISPTYLYLWISSENFRQQCAVVKGATDMADYVNLRDQRRMTFLIPDSHVTAAFDQHLVPLMEAKGLFMAHLVKLSAARDLLLPRLVTGEIDVSRLDLDPVVGVSV